MVSSASSSQPFSDSTHLPYLNSVLPSAPSVEIPPDPCQLWKEQFEKNCDQFCNAFQKADITLQELIKKAENTQSKIELLFATLTEYITLYKTVKKVTSWVEKSLWNTKMSKTNLLFRLKHFSIKSPKECIALENRIKETLSTLHAHTQLSKFSLRDFVDTIFSLHKSLDEFCKEIITKGLPSDFFSAFTPAFISRFIDNVRPPIPRGKRKTFKWEYFPATPFWGVKGQFPHFYRALNIFLLWEEALPQTTVKLIPAPLPMLDIVQPLKDIHAFYRNEMAEDLRQFPPFSNLPRDPAPCENFSQSTSTPPTLDDTKSPEVHDQKTPLAKTPQKKKLSLPFKSGTDLPVQKSVRKRNLTF